MNNAGLAPRPTSIEVGFFVRTRLSRRGVHPNMKESVEFFFFRLLNGIARKLSFRTAGRIGALLGKLAFALTGVRKSVTFDNLEKAFPELGRKEIRNIARGAYVNYGIAVVEMMWSAGQSLEVLSGTVHFANPHVMEQALAQRKGAIFVSGHFGSWELLVPALGHEFKRPVTAIAQRQRNRQIDALLQVHRFRFGNSTIPMGVSARRVIAALQEEKIVTMLGDQSGPKESVFIDFFGRPSATHRGAAAFSLKTGAPIVMGFLVRKSDGTYEFILEEVDRTGLDQYTEENIVELTQRHTAILEKYIRLHPDHWLWMHKRWKHTEYYESQKAIQEKF